MNAIIALCHFCEMHGPSVVFCTQAFHDTDFAERPLESNQDQNGLPRKRYYGRPECYQRTNSSGSTSDIHLSVKASEKCEACRSIPPGQIGYISNDHEAKVSYVSTQDPFHKEVFSLVRQACVRSLSCEVCPGREGPIFFGDEQRGHVLSHTFFLKDSHARGFQRWYSIIILMMDKIFLLNSWTFLEKHVKTVINELKEKANKVYNSEQADFPQRAIRLNSVTGMTPGNFRRQRGGSKTMRAIEEIVDDKDTFASLHLWFTWILKAGGNRLTEEILEGPLAEDTIIAIEKREETEEGFTLVTTKKILAPPMSTNEESKNDISGNGTKLRWLFKVMGEEKFILIAYHLIIGNQIIIRSSNEELVKSVIEALKIILPKGCCNIVYYSEHYVDSWKCNLLGLKNGVIVPPHVEASELHSVVNVSDEYAVLSPDCFSILSVLIPPTRNPTILRRIEQAIKNNALSDRVLSFYIVSIKEEWMNKVKVLYKFTRSSSPSAVETHKLLEVLEANESDKPVLKFWIMGLSAQFKTYILSSEDNGFS